MSGGFSNICRRVAVFETSLGQNPPDGARFSAAHFNPPARPALPLPNYYAPPLAINFAWSIIIVHKWNIIRQHGAAMLKHGVLGLLNYADMTGYEIREIFNKSLNFFWQAQSSQIYRELRTLEKKRLDNDHHRRTKRKAQQERLLHHKRRPRRAFALALLRKLHERHPRAPADAGLLLG